MQHLELLARLVALHRIHVQIVNLRIYFAVKTCYFWENHSLESYKVYYVKKLTNTYYLCKNDCPLGQENTPQSMATATSKTDCEPLSPTGSCPGFQKCLS